MGKPKKSEPIVEPLEPRYIVVSGEIIQSLQDSVNDFIVKGYSPVGGVCATPGEGYYQAMIRQENYQF